MFDLNERLLHLAHSLEGVRTELNGCTERFYYGSPQGQEKFFLEVLELGGITYALRPHPHYPFRREVMFPHPRYTGWMQVIDPHEEDEEALWHGILYAYQQVASPQHLSLIPFPAAELPLRRSGLLRVSLS